MTQGVSATPPSRISSAGWEKLILKFHLTMDEQELHKRATSTANKKLVALLADEGVLDERLFLRFAASSLSLRLVNVHDTAVRTLTESARLLGSLPQNFAMLHRCIPLRRDNERVVIALADPLDMDTISELQTIYASGVEVCLAPERDIIEALEQIASDDDLSVVIGGADGSDSNGSNRESDESQARTAPITSLVNSILVDGIRTGSSDMHFEPTKNGFDVVFRADGMLATKHTVPKDAQPAVTSRIKLLSGMDITERRRPQDGRITLQVGKKAVDLRVSTVPTPEGEKLVLRVLSGSNASSKLETLTFPPQSLALFQEMLSSTDGVILVTGPTGSGKTTTLYAAIGHVKESNRHVITVEDPIERRLPGITQIQIDAKVNMTFASGLRSILRQDPDVILVGEIRDLETAETACHAAQTGHLVLSTLHTNDAPSAITRMRDLGIESFSIASSLRGIVAQRLVRTLCSQCARPMRPDEIQKAQKKYGIAYDSMKAPVGCKQCSGGYKGRAGLYSLLPVIGAVRIAIHEEKPERELVELARPLGYSTLMEAGHYLLEQGLTTYDEIERVLGALSTPEQSVKRISGKVGATDALPASFDFEEEKVGPEREDSIQDSSPLSLSFEFAASDIPAQKIVNTSIRETKPVPVEDLGPISLDLHDDAEPEPLTLPKSIKPASPAPQAKAAVPAASSSPKRSTSSAPVTDNVTDDEDLGASLLSLASKESKGAPAEKVTKQRILLVDDDTNVRRVLSKALRERNFDVEEAATADDALALLDSARPALIVCDLEMPEVDGRVFLSELRAGSSHATIPVLMLMESEEEDIEVELLEIGASDTVRKNSSLKLILSRVQRLLR